MKRILAISCSAIGFVTYISMGIIRGLHGGMNYKNAIVINLGLFGLVIVILGAVLLTIFTIQSSSMVDNKDTKENKE